MLSFIVVLTTLVLTASFFKEQEKVEKRQVIVLEELRKEENKRIQIWADAVSQMASINIGETLDPCVLDILKSNNTIPAIWLGANGELKAHRNLNTNEIQLKKLIKGQEKKLLDSSKIKLLNDSLKIIQDNFEKELKIDSILNHQLSLMRYSIPIKIKSAKKDKYGNIILDEFKNPITQTITDYVYYRDSYVIKEFNNLSDDGKAFADKLQKLPIIILLVTISIFLVAYLAFFYSKKSQQDKLWAGIAKETAHQIGTPLSSLMGWVEYLKNKNIDKQVILEIKKDTSRLQQIADRFSKIGSNTLLKPVEVVPLLEKTIDYVKKRASKKITFEFLSEEKFNNVKLNLSAELFSWVVENVLKNSIDSLQNTGLIRVNFKVKNDKYYIIDIIDNGKGISSNEFKKIFDPGHTSKKRGWGLGLSLCKRIITEYHMGKIYVFRSTPYKETIIRIILKR